MTNSDPPEISCYPSLRVRRCAIRMNVLGFYSPSEDTITTYYPADVQDKYPNVTFWHEYIHHVLTTSTDMGIIDSLFCTAKTTLNISSALVCKIDMFIDHLLDTSFNTHEGTATYLSLFFGLQTSPIAPREIFSLLPEEYQQAVGMLSPPFPEIDNLSIDSIVVFQSLLLACARVALSLSGLESFSKHKRPVTWDFLTEFILSHRSDNRFARILKTMKQPESFHQFNHIVQDHACRFWDISHSNWLKQVNKLVLETNESQYRLFLEDLAVHLDAKIHDVCPDLGPYVNRNVRSAALTDFVRACNADLCSDLPEGLFLVTKIRAGSDPPPKARTISPGPGRDSWMFASVEYQPIQARDIISGLLMLKEVRKTGVDLWFQSKVFINPLDEELPLAGIYALPPLHTLLTFLPWIPPGQEELVKKVRFVGPFIESPSSIVLPNSRVPDVLGTLQGTEVLWHIDWIMYHCGRRAGINVDQWPGLKLVSCDNADSDIFENHVRTMARNSPVHLYAKWYHKKSVLVLVAYEVGSLFRWSLPAPEYIIHRMIEKLVTEHNISFLGKKEKNHIELDLKADVSLIFQYGL